MAKAAIILGMARFFTRRGDDGTTGLLGKGRVAKDHPRIEAAGDLDEASAALGLARAAAASPEARSVLLEVQRDLYRVMSEVSAEPEAAGRLERVDGARVEWLERRIEELAGRIEALEGFILPGDTLASAALDLARTVVRRAERRITGLAREGMLQNAALQAYVNRLSSLCFVLELWEIRQAGLSHPTLAQQKKR